MAAKRRRRKTRTRTYRTRRTYRRRKTSSRMPLFLIGIFVLIVCAAITSCINREDRYEYDPVTDVQMNTENREYNMYDMTNLISHNGIYSYEDDHYTSQFGVDVSEHNGTIDWTALKADGVQFAMIRIGYRGYDQGTITEDSAFARNIKGAHDAGIQVGVYFFSQAVSEDEAAQEAKWVIERLHSESIDLPVVYDMEMYSDETNARGNTTTRQQRTADAAVFLDNIANAGYSPMLYASTGTYDTVFDPQYLTGYPFWVAEYDTVCSYPYTYAMWQYSESGTLNGVSTNVDLDIRLIEK
ncbi:MAG: glycoside hydrolase family 25 protein [Lactimicrobium massiliense]|nr:glycoside hydrolase family 25 protein [Lactimicrobium massiliense]MDD6559671.1 glycoside hydrolase family 25 protein [Lactimicrobium massiliense]